MPDAEGNDWTAESIANITKEEYHAMSDDEYDKLPGDALSVLSGKAKDGNWDEFSSESSVE